MGNEGIVLDTFSTSMYILKIPYNSIDYSLCMYTYVHCACGCLKNGDHKPPWVHWLRHFLGKLIRVVSLRSHELPYRNPHLKIDKLLLLCKSLTE